MITLMLALKLTVVFALAGLTTFAMRRRQAAARHLVWGLALGGALALPFLSFVLPRVELEVLPRVGSGSEVLATALAHAPVRTVKPAADDVATSESTAAVQTHTMSAPNERVLRSPYNPPATFVEPAGNRMPDVPWLPVAWLGGSVIFALLVLASVRATARLARHATTLRRGALREELDACRTTLGMRRPVRLLLSQQQVMPMTWGARRPTILLPAAAIAWTAERRRDVLLHELAHVRRLDWLSQLGARFVCAAYWWHPLAWYAARQMREERELACDDLVISQSMNPADYAHHLLAIARDLRASPATALAGIAMARPSQLASRLLAALDATRRRGGVSSAHAGAAVTATVTLMLTLASLTAVSANVGTAASAPVVASPRVETPTAVAPPSATKSVAAPVGEERALVAPTSGTSHIAAPSFVALRLPPHDVSVPTVGRPQFSTVASTLKLDDAAASVTLLPPTAANTLCRWDGVIVGRTTSHVEIDDERATIRLTRNFCELHLRSRGHVLFSDDERDVAELAPQASFELEERGIGSKRRRAEFERRDNAIVRRFTVDGRDAPWDASARAWFQSALLVAFRRTGFQAQERVARLYARGGEEAVLAEVEHISSSSVLATYLSGLSEGVHLTSAQARRIAWVASERISSSSALGSVLKTLLRNPGLDDEGQAGVVASAVRIGSSSEHAEVLIEAVEYGPLTPILADAVCQSAREISSPSARSAVLVAVGDHLPANTPLPAPYFEAARGVTSDSQLRSVLVQLLTRHPLDDESLSSVLDVVGGIGSSSERGGVLESVLAKHRLSDRTRAPYFAAVEGIGSSSTKAAVLRAVIAAAPDAATTERVLRAVESVSSSSARAEVLVATARAGLVRAPVLRAAYERAAASIPSSSARERALRALGV